MADVDVSVDAAVGVSLAYHDLNFTVQLSRTRKGEPATKAILTRVTGVCGAGRVHAIMGPSGAGKTSMLDILAAFARGIPAQFLVVAGKRRRYAVPNRFGRAGDAVQCLVGRLACA